LPFTANQLAHVDGAPDLKAGRRLRDKLQSANIYLTDALVQLSDAELDVSCSVKNGVTSEEVQRLREVVQEKQTLISECQDKCLYRFRKLCEYVHILKRYDESKADTHSEYSRDMLATTVLLVEMRRDLCTQEPVKSKFEKFARKVLG
jgi:hypothetical protein